MNENPESPLTKLKFPQNHFILYATLGFILSLCAVTAALLSGFGTRGNWWPFQSGFLLLRWAAYGALAAAVISAWSLVGNFSARFKGSRRGFIFAFFGLGLSLLIIGICLYWVLMARHVPPIHDITTDPFNPPRLAAILPLRENAPNSPIYGGPLVAARQSEAYPDVKPLLLPIPPAQAFARALVTARKMGWEIVHSDASEGRIEATDTTFWFGFKDDIVIRVAPADPGSRIDMRSVSRVGKSDLGTNAARICNYLKRLAVSSAP